MGVGQQGGFDPVRGFLDVDNHTRKIPFSTGLGRDERSGPVTLGCESRCNAAMITRTRGLRQVSNQLKRRKFPAARAVAACGLVVYFTINAQVSTPRLFAGCGRE